MTFEKKVCYKLTWQEVSKIVAEEVGHILGHPVSYIAQQDDIDYWGGTFEEPVTLVEICLVLQTIHATREQWESALPDEGGTEIYDIGWDVGEALLRRNTGISWVHHLIMEDGLWLLDVAETQEPAKETVSIGGVELCFEDLKSKEDLFLLFDDGACEYVTLMKFCEGYKRKYGHNLCWPYTIAEGKHLGRFLVLVREGVLSLPYDGFNGGNYEFFSLEGAHLLTADELTALAEEWKSFSKDLLGAVGDMAAYLRKQEGQNG